MNYDIQEKIMEKKKKIMAGAAGLFLFLVMLLYCSNIEKKPLISTEGQNYEKAVVEEVTKDNLAEDGNRYGDQEVVLTIKTGELKGNQVEAISPGGNLFGTTCVKGMKVIAIVNVSGEENVVTVYAQDRTVAIYAFLAVFILTVCLIGGKKGVKAIISLAFTGICILYLLFPMLYRGHSPILVTIGICVAATVFTLVFVGGVTKKTAAAIVGTSSGVAAAGFFALVFGHFAGISGMNVSNIETLNYVGMNTQIQVGELLFAGIVLSSLGAVMDVGMSLASTVQELYDTNPAIEKKQLFLSAIHVGQDMMGTMINTLILAFVGGSLSGLVINYAYNLSYNQLMNSYNIGIEIMQGLAGSMGIVLTVPITAVVAVTLVCGRK